MKVEDLRKIIYEEVVKAMRAEFREILTEAVDIVKEQKPVQRTPVRLSDLIQVEESSSPKSIESILQETAQGMKREDYKALLGESQQVQKPVMPGMPDFLSKAISNAKGVFDKSNRVDLERHGV